MEKVSKTIVIFLRFQLGQFVVHALFYPQPLFFGNILLVYPNITLVIILFLDPVFHNMRWLVDGSGMGGTRFTPLCPATCMHSNTTLSSLRACTLLFSKYCQPFSIMHLSTLASNYG